MAWSKSSEGKDILFQETVTVGAPGSAIVAQIPTSVISNADADWENKKITVRLRVTEACAADGDIDAYIQTSVDGLTTGDVTTAGSGAYPNWVNAATLNYDLANTLDATGTLQADLTDVYAPYMRVWLFTDGADIADDTSIQVSIALSANDDLATADIGGVGVDPS